MALLPFLLATFITLHLTGVESPAYSCRSLAGDRIDLTAHAGKALLVAFVNTECGSCVRVTLRVVDVYRSLMRRDDIGFLVVAINDDASEKLPRFVADVSLPFPACTDTKANAERFLGIPRTGVMLTPLVVFLDRQGIVRDEMPPTDKRLAEPGTIKDALERIAGSGTSPEAAHGAPASNQARR